jgi:hypothetical protein
VLTVVTSTLTTALIAWLVATRIRTWRPFRIEGEDRLVALFLVVLPANAMFDIVYEKDVVLSVAGILYVAAATVAVKRIARDMSLSTLRSAVAYAVVLLVVCGWSVRTSGTHYRLRQVASIVRTDWAYYDRWQQQQQTVVIDTPGGKQLWQTLYDDAIWRQPAPRPLTSRMLEAWSDSEQ